MLIWGVDPRMEDWWYLRHNKSCWMQPNLICSLCANLLQSLSTPFNMNHLMNHNKWGHFTAVLLIEKKNASDKHFKYPYFFIFFLLFAMIHYTMGWWDLGMGPLQKLCRTDLKFQSQCSVTASVLLWCADPVCVLLPLISGEKREGLIIQLSSCCIY